MEEHLIAVVVGEKIINEVLKCNCCGSRLEYKGYGFKCPKCKYVYLLKDVEIWLDKYFTDERVERENIIHDQGYESAVEDVLRMIDEGKTINEVKEDLEHILKLIRGDT